MNQRRITQADQLDVLEHIAAFAAKVRGHQLTGWKRSRHSATAACSACRRTVTVYRSLVQPVMQGGALEDHCKERVRHAA